MEPLIKVKSVFARAGKRGIKGSSGFLRAFRGRHEEFCTNRKEDGRFFECVENIMGNQIADVIVHVDESLTRDQLKTLEDRMHEIEGVVSACNRDNQTHAILVTFDPSRIKALDILASVKRKGYHAELVGL